MIFLNPTRFLTGVYASGEAPEAFLYAAARKRDEGFAFVHIVSKTAQGALAFADARILPDYFSVNLPMDADENQVFTAFEKQGYSRCNVMHDMRLDCTRTAMVEELDSVRLLTEEDQPSVRALEAAAEEKPEKRANLFMALNEIRDGGSRLVGLFEKGALCVVVLLAVREIRALDGQGDDRLLIASPVQAVCRPGFLPT